MCVCVCVRVRACVRARACVCVCGITSSRYNKIKLLSMHLVLLKQRFPQIGDISSNAQNVAGPDDKKK